jgi:hypothetical protein
MITGSNAHGCCTGGNLLGGSHPKNINIKRIKMETVNRYLLQHKLEYLKLTVKISRIRYHGKEPDRDLLLEAQKIGLIADIEDNELNNLLFNLNIQ